MKGKTLTNKARTIISTVLVVYAFTVAVNLGEFWPFSIYPMFSQGGNPWSRALVREIPEGEQISWDRTDLDNLPGIPYGVSSNGVDAIDLANFVSKTETWNTTRVRALSFMLLSGVEDARKLQVFRVQANLDDADNVVIRATPYLIVSNDSNFVNPGIQP